MTNKEKEIIYNDIRYYVIYWEGGKIYTKFSLIESRAKRIEKLFKGVEYHIRPCSYNDYFMANVLFIYRRLNRTRQRYLRNGYRRIWDNNGGYRWESIEND